MNRKCKEIGLLSVVAFDHDTVRRSNLRFQCFYDPLLPQYGAGHPTRCMRLSFSTRRVDQLLASTTVFPMMVSTGILLL
jgi:hypothetical protein